MKILFLNKQKISKNTYSFLFKKPNKFSYLPGQYLYLSLPHFKNNDYKGPTRIFTISSSPTEKNIMITTRIRKKSKFKLELLKLKKNTTVEFEGPSGTFILDEHEIGHHVLIAGGIGITPFRSFIKYSIDKNLPNKIDLIFSDKSKNDFPFYRELLQIKKAHKHINIYMTATRIKNPKNWSGLTGRINSKMIKSILKNNKLNQKTYWICGPPPMVMTVEQELLNLKIKHKNIRIENFTGY